MGTDPFYDEIETALASLSNGTLFQDCACDILRETYRGLVGRPGGKDDGVDGVISDELGEAILVCTVGADVIGNLSASLTRYINSGGDRRQVVVATSQKLSPKRVVNLEKRAKELGFTMRQVHQRRQIADLLYYNPRWCVDLLGLVGQPSALSVVPLATRRQLSDRLVGREMMLNQLRDLREDAVVIGRPAVGKTAVLRALVSEGWGLFLVDTDPTNIAKALRRQQPRVVVVDDAHIEGAGLQTLNHLRAELGANFSIVASCWLGFEDQLLTTLDVRANAVHHIDLLTRDEIVDVIRAVGLTGPLDLVREIVDQSQCRPGLAATLAHECIYGKYLDVVLGDALKRSIMASVRQDDPATAGQVLAVIAIGGDSGMPTDVVATPRVAAPHLVVSNLRRSLGSVGIQGLVRRSLLCLSCRCFGRMV